MNPFILHIETSADLCSVALSRGEICAGVRESSEPRSHSSVLAPFIDDLLRANGVAVRQLDAVAVSAGPGSYTGLRIGVSTAKGLCYGADVPLISVFTLQAMSMGYARQHDFSEHAVFCPMIDARRMEVYTALYGRAGEELEKISAEVITDQSFAAWLDRGEVYFFGDGAAKCRQIITHPNACFPEDFAYSARCMIPLALRAYSSRKFESVAYFEPFYLKDFIAGPAKKYTAG